MISSNATHGRRKPVWGLTIRTGVPLWRAARRVVWCQAAGIHREVAGPSRVGSIGGRQGFRALDLQCNTRAGQCALAAFDAQQFERAGIIRVTLAQLRALAGS